MAGALTFLLIGCLLQGVQCGQWRVNILQTIEVLRGSCVTIPCSFHIDRTYDNNLDQTCKAVWKNRSNSEVVFDSKTRTNGELIGALTDKDCTTTLNNMVSDGTYLFRLECENALKWEFSNDLINIVTKADPPSPTLTPSTLEVEEGKSVNVTCSAPAPCLSHPPTLTWSPRLGDSQETLQENQDKTKVQTSVLTFTASQLHHGQKISCTALYRKQDGSPDASVTTALTANVSCVQCEPWRVNMLQTIEVLRGSCVTIPCSFDIDRKYNNNLDQTCKAVWKKRSNDEVVFDSKTRTNGELIGALTDRDCTTTLNNMVSDDTYYFRLECENDLKYSFNNDLNLVTKADPPSPTLTPSTLEVEEGTSVSVTCSAPAPCLSHPPTLTWSPRLGDSQETLQENQDRTKVQTSVLTFTASQLHHGQKISCTALYRKQDGSNQSSSSKTSALTVSFPPQILASSHCTKTESQVNCSCETVGNPSPTLHWHLDGRPVNQSGEVLISSGSLNGTGLRSFITVNKLKDRSLSTLFCHSFNSLGSARQQFCVNTPEDQRSTKRQDQLMSILFITTTVTLLVLVCVLLFVIRAQKNYRDSKSQLTGETSTTAPSQGIEAPSKREEAIYANTDDLRQADSADPETISEPNRTNLPSTGPDNVPGERHSSENNEEGSDVLYSTVNWKNKSKKNKVEDSVDMNPSGSSYLEEEKYMAKGMCKNFVSNAMVMGNLYDEAEPRNVGKEVECEYAQVKFKRKSTMHK
ncbi:myelin-associated glycoprotein-like [Mugil cephalus]|uniref:myelin-associated glycoprotein-like n=1 Tax=Mugil cephalus TaxID=48193 RepID=UPI001FB5B576|nr:myelin-associated glycoprotein-like [Mugil cephalus]